MTQTTPQAKIMTSLTSLSMLATDGAPAAGVGSSIGEDVDVDTSFSASAADATTARALRRAVATKGALAAAGAARALGGIHREEGEDDDGDNEASSTAGLAEEDAWSIVLARRTKGRKKMS